MAAALACACLSTVAAAQESAAEFNRNEWQRRNNGGGNVFGGPKSSVPAARRQEVSRREAAPSRPAPARDFFSALFGGGFQSGGSSYGDSRYDDSRARILITPGPGGEIGNGGLGHSGSGTMAFCVRSCDGRYFPLQGRPSGPGDPNAIAQCAAFCPAAKTEVFVSYSKEAGIDGAVDKAGKSYADIPNAFTFRQRLVENCSCNGQALGVGRIDVKDDPTLKAGDVVMTADGARVFSGKRSRPPFRDGDFVVPERFPNLPKSLRQRIAELTVL